MRVTRRNVLIGAATALVEREETPALFIVREGEGLREIMTVGFTAMVIA